MLARSFASLSFGSLNRAIRCSGFARTAAAKNELGSVSRMNLYARINSRSLHGLQAPSDLMNLKFLRTIYGLFPTIGLKFAVLIPTLTMIDRRLPNLGER